MGPANLNVNHKMILKMTLTMKATMQATMKATMKVAMKLNLLLGSAVAIAVSSVQWHGSLILLDFVILFVRVPCKHVPLLSSSKFWVRGFQFQCL